MDAAGLSRAILGLIAEITAAVDRAQSAPKEIRGVYDRLKTLQGCLETLLRSSDASSAIKAHLQRWDEVVKGLSSDVNELLGTIQELHDKLGSKGLKKLQAKMGFVIDRDKIRRLEGQLSTHIETLELLSGTLNV
jgi:predicted  nucleic acid-binding Zn-ribbon protein